VPINTPINRKRTGSVARYVKRPTKRARKVKFAGRAGIARVVSKMIGRTVETKESQERANSGILIQEIKHNNTLVVQNQTRSLPLNPFTLGAGIGDPMNENSGARIGDQVTLKGLSIKMFLENPIDRSNTYYRIMLIKGAKGENFDRANLFKGKSPNKMMDVINTERFTIISQKIVNLKASNGTSGSISLTGVPGAVVHVGTATRLVTMWIPGGKFGRNGNLQYENGSSTQLKFYDYRIVILCYDWFGTPQDANTVGKLNDLITTLYYKDA
jgi:hypothetical protein